jgi:hypothetical protein
VPTTKLAIAKSELASAEETVYAPVKVVPVEAAVRTISSVVPRVTVNDDPVRTASLIVAVILIKSPLLYEPFDVLEVKPVPDATVGAVVSL